MAKYIVNVEKDIIDIKSSGTLMVGDIIVHKPIEFYVLQRLFIKHFPDIDVFPVGSGTQCYTINGYNTSAIRSM